MGVNLLYVSAAATAASAIGLQRWLVTMMDGIRSDGLIDGGEIDSANVGRVLELLLGSQVTVALIANLAVNVFLLLLLCLKILFFVQLYPSETRKLLDRLINYVIYRGTFLPLVVPPNVFQIMLWSTWLMVLCSLKMFQSLARDRLERLNASPSVTPAKYFRVFSALLFVLSADLLWLRLSALIYRSFTSKLYLLLLFEPLSIAFETLQAVMMHGFQLVEIWQRHSIDNDINLFGAKLSYKSAAGALSEWRGILIRNGGFLLDMMTLLMALGHYLTIWWLHGMAFHFVDAALFLNTRALVSATVKRIKGYVKLKKALCSLDGALPDATYDDLCSYDDECAICRGPMAKAKKLSCNHLFHLSCLRSWLDQGLSDMYSCPTCRRPLFPSGQEPASSLAGEISIDTHVAEAVNEGLDQQTVSGQVGALSNRQRVPADTVWRGVGFNSSLLPNLQNPGADDVASTSDPLSLVGLSGVQMMMRQLTSVGENYSRRPLEEPSWSLWASNHALSSSSAVPSSAIEYNRNTRDLRFRSMTPSLERTMSEMHIMADRVREVLPHIPDELIVQDLLRTNNVNITVNNLLQLQ